MDDKQARDSSNTHGYKVPAHVAAVVERSSIDMEQNKAEGCEQHQDLRPSPAVRPKSGIHLQSSRVRGSNHPHIHCGSGEEKQNHHLPKHVDLGSTCSHLGSVQSRLDHKGATDSK